MDRPSLKIRLLRRLFAWFGRMRPSTRLRLGKTLGWLSYKLVKPRVRVARRNLELCFPALTGDEREHLLRQHFHALAQSVLDRGVLWFGTPDAVRAMVRVEGFEHLQRCLDDKQPSLLLAPHFIGLDAAASRLTMDVPSSATMYSTQSDAEIDALIREGRTRFNDVQLVSRRDGIRTLLKHVRDGRPIYYLPDMDFGSRGSIFAPFFGNPAATLTSTAQIAGKWALPVLPILSVWHPEDGTYTIRVLPPLEDFPGEDGPEAATVRLNQLIEGWVRECPSQYYWVHRRFKTTPPGMTGRY
ncbi:lysophospholipid acyltransferase family protein [Kerstersia gyiorum]|uniref:Acyltransferase n=1 Tax=Kerstersia gyiorum TaxID=206506 RepID=A0A171KWP1_9BURK|nr:lysophospholipid acyltransferase family protein [Kerstersia gyiorum]KKO73308.1 acyltransferase [Kerstersia gyiorum]QBR41910.1 acyltransferase [Kerstersia gyiorum]RZS73381.1 KDO2-lipid IV(A) lauroyltransferase [Kerstersia gyiorum]